MMTLRKGYKDDLNLKEIWVNGLTWFALWTIISFVLIVILFLVFSSEHSSEAEYNAKAEQYNALSLSERQCLWQYGGRPYDCANTDTYQLELMPAYTVIERFKRMPVLVLVLWALSLVALASWFMTWQYRCCKKDRFFYADFPLQSPAYVATFAMMLLGTFPVFMVSGVRMLSYRYRKTKDEQSEVKRLAQLEAIASESRQILPPRVAQCGAVDVKRYCRVRVSLAEAYRQEAIKQAQVKVEAEQNRLAELGQSLQRTQRSLNAAKAKLKEAESAIANLQTPTTARNELDLIREMRGVSKVSVPKTAGKDKSTLLRFVVKVRVPYQDELYDFGDYEISFKLRDFECKHLRSGVRLNATSTYPDYSTSNGFCFGNRASAIRDYVKAGRYAEAATLVVDSLHSVNSKDAEAEIPKCFRKVRIVERKAKWFKFAEKKG